MRKHVVGIASLSYRLSAHPSHPQPPSTPATELRDAKHPDHLLDIVTSISFLQKKYGFGSRYMLVGHSCGATLAFQSLVLARMGIPTSVPFQNPEIVVGVAGIYDLRLLRDNNSHPAYQEFIAGAFGNDEEIWDAVSPAQSELLKAWPEAKTVVLVSSSRDELIDNGQIDCMGASLKAMGEQASVLVLKDFLDMPHDDQWIEGLGMANVVIETLKAWEGNGRAASRGLL